MVRSPEEQALQDTTKYRPWLGPFRCLDVLNEGTTYTFEQHDGTTITADYHCIRIYIPGPGELIVDPTTGEPYELKAGSFSTNGNSATTTAPSPTWTGQAIHSPTPQSRPANRTTTFTPTGPQDDQSVSLFEPTQQGTSTQVIHQPRLQRRIDDPLPASYTSDRERLTRAGRAHRLTTSDIPTHQDEPHTEPDQPSVMVQHDISDDDNSQHAIVQETTIQTRGQTRARLIPNTAVPSCAPQPTNQQQAAPAREQTMTNLATDNACVLLTRIPTTDATVLPCTILPTDTCAQSAPVLLTDSRELLPGAQFPAASAPTITRPDNQGITSRYHLRPRPISTAKTLPPELIAAIHQVRTSDAQSQLRICQEWRALQCSIANASLAVHTPIREEDVYLDCLSPQDPSTHVDAGIGEQEAIFLLAAIDPDATVQPLHTENARETHAKISHEMKPEIDTSINLHHDREMDELHIEWTINEAEHALSSDDGRTSTPKKMNDTWSLDQLPHDRPPDRPNNWLPEEPMIDDGPAWIEQTNKHVDVHSGQGPLVLTIASDLYPHGILANLLTRDELLQFCPRPQPGKVIHAHTKEHRRLLILIVREKHADVIEASVIRSAARELTRRNSLNPKMYTALTLPRLGVSTHGTLQWQHIRALLKPMWKAANINVLVYDVDEFQAQPVIHDIIPTKIAALTDDDR